MGSKFAHGAESLSVSAMLHEPTRGLGAEEYADSQDEGWDEGGAQLESPGDIAGVLNNDICAEAQKDACDDPELPEHDECATDPMGSHFSGVDGHGGVLRADADAHHETRREETLPCLREAGADRGSGKAQSRDEDLAAPAEVVV